MVARPPGRCTACVEHHQLCHHESAHPSHTAPDAKSACFLAAQVRPPLGIYRGNPIFRQGLPKPTQLDRPTFRYYQHNRRDALGRLPATVGRSPLS